jgi:hypothetical protein
LSLNGVGLRAVLWLKGYAAGLYLSARATTPAQVLATTGAKRLQMRMLLDVDTEEFIKAFHKGIGRNTPQADAIERQRLARHDHFAREGKALDLDRRRCPRARRKRQPRQAGQQQVAANKTWGCGHGSDKCDRSTDNARPAGLADRRRKAGFARSRQCTAPQP